MWMWDKNKWRKGATFFCFLIQKNNHSKKHSFIYLYEDMLESVFFIYLGRYKKASFRFFRKTVDSINK